MAKVTFMPLSLSFELNEGESVFGLAIRHKISVATACVGKGTCGLCRVKIIAGGEQLPPVSYVEQKHLGNTYFITKLRLSCQLKPTADVTVLVPDVGKKK